MWWELAGRTAGGPVPWRGDSKELSRWVRERVSFDAMAIGLLHGRSPQADEWLHVEGWNPAELARRWPAEVDRDPLLRQAKRRGAVAMSPPATGDGQSLAGGAHALAWTIADPMTPHRAWWLVMTRAHSPFSESQLQQAGLILRRWQVAFDQLAEPVVGRLLLGHDSRLIHADPTVREQMLKHPDLVEELMSQLAPVIAQRWPQLEDGQVHDAAFDVAGQCSWIVFRRGRALPDDKASWWYIEIRGLEEGELPCVASIEDERIAKAVAYLDDNFHRSPSLTQVSRAVFVSPFHFHRLFTRDVGISPKQYLQRKQLQVAKCLLRSTQVPIGSIAQYTGFSSHGHFTSTFHRILGVSPSQYREGGQPGDQFEPEVEHVTA